MLLATDSASGISRFHGLRDFTVCMSEFPFSFYEHEKIFHCFRQREDSLLSLLFFHHAHLCIRDEQELGEGSPGCKQVSSNVVDNTFAWLVVLHE